MRLNETRSAGEGLERSCQGTVARWRVSTRPAGGVELFSAWFAGEAYQKHRHDTYAMVMSRSVWKLSAASSGSPRQVIRSTNHSSRSRFRGRILMGGPAQLADHPRRGRSAESRARRCGKCRTMEKALSS
jgi:hypothetical protein